MRPEITLVSTGGTIASLASENDAASPELSGGDLVESVPELGTIADLSVESVGKVPSFDMDFDTMADVGEVVQSAAETGTDGVVVTHGTDTIEESAFYLSVAFDPDVPVVFTGAQVRPDEVGSDGPSNLLGAVQAVGHHALREPGGVYVAFAEELHAAKDVTKRHTSKRAAFASPGAGPVAEITRDGLHFYRTPGDRTPTVNVERTESRVALVASAAGVDGGPIHRALGAGVDGIVLIGTGIGNTTSGLGDAVDRGINTGVPVVVTSRCYAGSVRPTYGTVGGSATLRDHGAIFAGDLSPQKARILLSLSLATGDAPDDLRDRFDCFAPTAPESTQM